MNRALGTCYTTSKGLEQVIQISQEEERELGRPKKKKKQKQKLNNSQKLFKVGERHQFKCPRGSAHPNKKH